MEAFDDQGQILGQFLPAVEQPRAGAIRAMTIAKRAGYARMDEASFKKCLSADDSVRGIRAALRSPGLRPHVIRELERYERPGEDPEVGACR